MSPSAELVDGWRPLDTGGRRGPAHAAQHHRLPVNGVRNGATDAHVVERRHIRAHVDAMGDVGQEVLVGQLRMTLLDRLQVFLTHCPPGGWATVDLPGAIHRQPG